ncbi:VanW family protein [Dethiothermospora halolimnae]|uniref:VanW family protein n=1 Tax=Dethiothermospora halolimnae TaxID=3114390 RepID=UPI003CCC44CE
MYSKLRPKNRSKIRLILGKAYYKIKRYFQWYFSDKKYSKNREEELLKYKAFSHKTPLYRKLKNVDMWLQENKVINLQITIEKLNRITIYPGETFSFWKLVGNPTRKKGYVEGMVLVGGDFTDEVGGGLCQLSNLLYWMTLHTPLTVSERYRHSYDVFPDSNRTQPFGSGATLVYNYRDLQIYNGTDEPYQLCLSLTDEYLVGEWRTTYKPIYKYEIYEKEHKITHEYWGGYLRHNVINRKIYNGEETLLDDEYITENHALMMYQPFLEESNQ